MSPKAEAILTLHHAEHGRAEIARQVGCSKAFVTQVLQAAGIARPAHRTKQTMEGGPKAPERAVASLRRFSWEPS